MTAILSDAEVSALCHPLRQYAAQIRHLERMGLRPLRRPDGAPIVLRSALEALNKPAQNGKTAGPVWGVHA